MTRSARWRRTCSPFSVTNSTTSCGSANLRSSLRPPTPRIGGTAFSPGSEETPSGIALQAEAKFHQESLLADLLRQLIYELRDRNAFTDLQVIELVFYAGRRNLDVAELLEIDQKAVAGIKFRAIQKLQNFLAEPRSPSSRLPR